MGTRGWFYFNSTISMRIPRFRGFRRRALAPASTAPRWASALRPLSGRQEMESQAGVGHADGHEVRMHVERSLIAGVSSTSSTRTRSFSNATLYTWGATATGFAGICRPPDLHRLAARRSYNADMWRAGTDELNPFEPVVRLLWSRSGRGGSAMPATCRRPARHDGRRGQAIGETNCATAQRRGLIGLLRGREGVVEVKVMNGARQVALCNGGSVGTWPDARVPWSRAQSADARADPAAYSGRRGALERPVPRLPYRVPATARSHEPMTHLPVPISRFTGKNGTSPVSVAHPLWSISNPIEK